LVAVVVFALLRFSVAAREARSRGAGARTSCRRRSRRPSRGCRRRSGHRRRAEASERLSGEIISGLSAGLLVVGLKGEIRILNPAGRRC
jgi:hypothetical protein